MRVVRSAQGLSQVCLSVECFVFLCLRLSNHETRNDETLLAIRKWLIVPLKNLSHEHISNGPQHKHEL